MSRCVVGPDLNPWCHRNKRVEELLLMIIHYYWQVPLQPTLLKHLCNLRAVRSVSFSLGLVFITE